MSSPSARLQARLALVAPSLSGAAARVLGHPDPAALYPEYLLAMHGISRAAVPVMEAAVAAAERLPATDAVAGPLLAYLREHIPEETGHADWILEDLGHVGLERAACLERVPSVLVAEMVGAQYYWAAHVHPVAVMGYLGIMEANPPTRAAVDELVERTGLPPEAFRSMRTHAQLDIRHEAELHRALDRLPLTSWQERLVIMSALRTAELLLDFMVEIHDRFDAARAQRIAG